MTGLFSRLFGTRHARTNRRLRTNRLGLEPLECRNLMAVTGFTLPFSLPNQTVFIEAEMPGARDFVVTRTRDSGPGTLRWAITQANADPGPNRIVFNLVDDGSNAFEDVDSHLPGGDAEADVFVFRIETALPRLADTRGGTTIDGRTQASFGGNTNAFGPDIVLDGSRVQGNPVPGLYLAPDSDGNRVFGLNIQGFSGDGVMIVRSDHNWLAGNYIGTDATGTEARPNGTTAASSAGGILISAGARRNLIGAENQDTFNPGERNLIAGNRRHGIRVQTGAAGDRTNDNVIRGNAIGTLTLGNEGPGVLLVGLAGGRAPEANTVSGNFILGNRDVPVRFLNARQDRNTIGDNIETQQQLDALFRQHFGATMGELAVAAGAPKAEFSWSMEERTGPDYIYNFDWADYPGQIPNVSEYISPPDGYGVTLDASASRSGAGNTITSYQWTVTGLTDPQQRRQAAGVRPSLHLPEGRYQVTLAVTDSAGRVETATGEIHVNDILIVSMGDSYASGEGNPHGKIIHGLWAVGGNEEASAYNHVAHRSIHSAPAQAAWLLESNDPHTSVTFVSVASSGAVTAELYTRSQGTSDVWSLGDDDIYLPPQVDQVLSLTGSRKIDTLFVSAGGNDIGFSEIIEDLLYDDYRRFATIQARIGGLAASYAALRNEIHDKLNVDPGSVYVTGYPDPTSDESPTGTPLRIMEDAVEGAFWVGDISYSEILLARNLILTPLNAQLRAAAADNEWNFVDLQQSLWGHGYAAADNWVVTWDESVDRQGRDGGLIQTRGVMHPNEIGHKAMAIEMAREAFGETLQRGMQRAPHVLETTTRIEVAAPPAGGAWAPQVVNVYFNGTSTTFQFGDELALLGTAGGLNREIAPVAFDAADVQLTAPDGRAAQILGVRYVGKSLFQIDFRPSGYGAYELSIGPDVRDAAGRPMDQDRDGISAYRSGLDERDRYFNTIFVQAPGSAFPNRPTSEPAKPAVGVDDNGDTIGSISQYSTSSLAGMTSPFPGGNQEVYVEPPSVEIPFSVATINTFLRPTHIWETDAWLAPAEPYYAHQVSNTTRDNRERTNLLMQEYAGFDIVAMQEVFDPDQVSQIDTLASLAGFHHLRGPGRDKLGWGPFSVRYGADAGLSLLVRGDLSDQASVVPADARFLEEAILKAEVYDAFQHSAVPFDHESFGLFDGEAVISNKGFTLDVVQLNNNDDHFVYVVNTHLHSSELNSRALQLREIRDFVARNTDREHPVLFLGDFNVAAEGPEYRILMEMLGYPYDPFEAPTDDVDYFTTDPRRNSYEYFERHTGKGNPAELSGRKRIDHILIRQGTKYALEVESVQLEDGADRGSDLETTRTRAFREDPRFSAYFAPQGTLVPSISDHFGLSAQLVFTSRAGGPNVVRTTTSLEVDALHTSKPSPSFYSPPPEVIEVAFDENVDVRTFTASDVLLRGPDGQIVPILNVRPWRRSDDPQPPGNPFLFDTPDALLDQKVEWITGSHMPKARRFAIEFYPPALGRYTLAIGTGIQDSLGNAMTNVHRSFVSVQAPVFALAPVTAEARQVRSAAPLVTTQEDAMVSGAVTASGLSGNGWSFRLAQKPAHGQAQINPNGTFAYTPAVNYHGADSFMYTATNDAGQSVTGTMFVGVSPVNDAPLASNGTASTREDQPVQIDLRTLVWDDETALGDLLFNVEGAVHGSVSLLADGYTARFVPQPDFHGGAGAGGFSYRVTDRGDSLGASLSSKPAMVAVRIAQVNDAPVIDASRTFRLAAIDQDQRSNSGTLVRDMLASVGDAISDVDRGAVQGIAVVKVDNRGGFWQFSLNRGLTWTSFGSPAETSARLLAADDNTRVRFVPDAGFHGTRSMEFRAWDRTSGASGGIANTVVHGGTTAYSTAVASVWQNVNRVLRFNLTSGTGFPVAGQTLVTGGQLYSDSRGYGWLKSATVFDSRSLDPLLRNGHAGQDNTFRIALGAGVRYTVTLNFRDQVHRHAIDIYAENELRIAGLSVPANTTVTRTITGTVGADGILDLRFIANGSDAFFIINALQIVAEPA